MLFGLILTFKQEGARPFRGRGCEGNEKWKNKSALKLGEIVSVKNEIGSHALKTRTSV